MLLMPEKYDPTWKTRFESYRLRLLDVPGVRDGCVQHIGSTAVAGLWAKPIIDMQIAVRDLAGFDLDTLSTAGFAPVPGISDDEPFRNVGAPLSNWKKKYARLQENDRRLAHVHVRQIGNLNHRFALLFRDFLRNDPETRDLYSEFKIAAARIAGDSSEPGGSGAYLDLKDPFVKLIACRAESWAARTAWRIPTE